jgi:hypothetical protein
MLDPFVGRRTLTPEQWKARGDAIRARLEGLSIDELMRGTHGVGPPHGGVPGQRRGSYDPNQPRVPAGHSDGGQWTDDDRWGSGRWANDRRDRPRGALQLAAGEPPALDPPRFALWLARKAIEAVLRELAKWDLFGHHDPEDVTAALTFMDGEAVVGTSSQFGDWRAIDHIEAKDYARLSCGNIHTS